MTRDRINLSVMKRPARCIKTQRAAAQKLWINCVRVISHPPGKNWGSANAYYLSVNHLYKHALSKLHKNHLVHEIRYEDLITEPEQVVAVLELANREGIPVIARGRGTGTTGATVPVADLPLSVALGFQPLLRSASSTSCAGLRDTLRSTNGTGTLVT